MESTYLHLTAYQRQEAASPGPQQFPRWTRYADHFVVSGNGTKAQALAMKEELRPCSCMIMGLTLSEEKTKITHITEGFSFLGYWIERRQRGN